MIKSLKTGLNIIFIISTVLAEVPSYLPVCGRKNPNLDKCILDSVNAVRPILLKGIPELGVPPIEPLIIAEGLPLANGKDLKASAKNVKIWNTPLFEASDLHADLKNHSYDFKLHFDRIKIEGDYEVNAKVLVPIQGVGSIDIDSYGVDAHVNLQFELVNTKKGQQVYFTSMTCKLKIMDYTAKFKAIEGPSATLSDAINSVINSNRQEVLDSITPALEKAISKKVLDISNSICKHFTFDELFPDRE